MKPIEERFWEHVDRRSDGCWSWIGAKPTEYGQMHVRGRLEKAPRISWEIHNGTIPPGLHVLHKCDHPPCVRPDHLFLGTHADNMHDMVVKGRARGWMAEITHCPQGHEYSSENTYVRPSGYRDCRECHRLRLRDLRRARSAISTGGKT